MAQTVESIPYRAILSTANEVPPVALAASGTGTVWFHVVRDASGEIISGSVDFDVNYKFPGEATITAMHIHDGAAGVNGPVVIDSAVSRTENVTAGSLPVLQAQISPAGAAAFAAFKGVIANPAGYYLNVHTTANPAGVFRGQLQRAEAVVRLAVLSPANENPPIAGLDAAGRGTILMLRTTDAGGNTTSAQVTFDVAYTGFPAGTEIIAMHLHAGPAGVNGPVTVDSTLTQAITVADSGNGFLRFTSEVDLARAGALATIDNVYWAPALVYLNAHTRANPGGAIRGQLLWTDSASFQVALSPANEVPPLTLEASAPGKVTVYTARNSDGAAIAGAITFDVNPRFEAAPATSFTAMHVHDGVAGVNGPVTLDSRFNSVPNLVKDGVGNIWRLNSLLPAALPSLNSLITNPERHYTNLHSTANPGGAVRAQNAAPNTALPEIADVIAGASDPAIVNLAPGGVASIFGANLSKVSGNIDGVAGTTVPTSLNGTSVTIGGRAAPVIFVDPGQINVQVPYETATGVQPIVVTTTNGASETMMHPVAPVAPAILFDATGALAFRVDNSSLIRPNNAAAAGDQIYLLCTGLGLTIPAGQTGQIPPSDITRVFLNVVQPTVTIGGRAAALTGAAAAPGFIGLNAVVVTVPTGLTAGNQPVVLRSGTVASNTASIAIK
jgi:uncharacterized protein (TIGR03437 family)